MAVSESKRNQIRAALSANPRVLTVMLARELGVPEADVIREFPAEHVRELDMARWEELLRAFENAGDVQVICTNDATTLESHGKFGGFSKTGPFFNVQTDTLDMHIRYERLGSAFAVEKPGHMDGLKTLSINFFDQSGASAFKVFLNFGHTPSAEQQTFFNEVKANFGLAAATSGGTQ